MSVSMGNGVDLGNLVTTQTNSLTGGIEIVGPDGTTIASTEKQSITLTGTYAGNGTSVSVNCGFEPDFVAIKSDSAVVAVFRSKASWYDRTDPFNNVDSTGAGITLTKTGFTVGAGAEVNTNAATHHYFAYKDNDSESLLQGNWMGNAAIGRKVDLFAGKPVKATIIKRDASQKSAWSWLGLPQSYDMDGNAGDFCTINADGTLTLNASNFVNQWANNLGEGTTGLAITGNSTFAAVYTGTGVAQRIPLPWEADFAIIQPLGVVGQNAHLWFSSLAAGQHAPIAPAALGTGRITSVDEGSLLISSGAQLNTNGTKYGVIAFKRNRSVTPVVKNAQTIYKTAIQLASGGYIDCGVSDSLKFDGAHTIEWFGAIYPTSTTPFAGGAGVDNEANKQFPIFCRTGGADGVAGAVSFALAALCPRPEGTGQRGGDWSGASISWATFDTWALPQTGSPVLDNFPAFSGMIMPSGRLMHIMLSHDGSGGWCLAINGQVVKERKRDLVAAIGKQNITGGAGHRTLFGARQRATIDYAYGQQFRLARIYNRGLTKAEMAANYAALFNTVRKPTAGFVEEWDARKASGTTLPATVNSANNGTIVSGVISSPS